MEDDAQRHTAPNGERPPGGQPLHSAVRSIGVKLFAWIFLVMIVVFGVFAYLSFTATSEQWMVSIRQSAHRTSSLIERSIHDGMLLNRKDDVHATIRSIAKSPGMAGIRIYDKTGTIIFSADEREVGKRVDLQAEACVACHEKDKPLRSLPQKDRVRVYRDHQGQQILGLINPIANAPECYTAACHAHPKEQSILGVLDVKMSIGYLDAARSRAKRDMWLMLLLVALVGGLATALFIYRVVRVPVRHLTDGIRRISSGHLGTRIELSSGDEMGELARAFNRMSDELAVAEREKQLWAVELERKVEEKTAELKRIQGQIAHMEKMASLGKLAATVAHEVNNPLAGVLVYAKLVARKLRAGLDADGMEELQRHVEVIAQETARCGDIVKNLLVFSRESRVKVAEQRLEEVLQRSLRLIGHKMELSSIELDFRREVEDDRLECDGQQIQQALLALLVNAVEAMEGGGGVLTVVLMGDAEHVILDITDTGVGIPESVKAHIFEPFYSTKEATKGVGLGLAVVYGIVHRHGGRIDVDSSPGEGSTFRVVLPRKAGQPTGQGEWSGFPARNGDDNGSSQ